MGMEVSSNYLNYNQAIHQTNNQKVKGKESIEEELPARQTAGEELRYLQNKYDGIQFFAMDVSYGTTYGSRDTTNIAISPTFLKKMAENPDTARAVITEGLDLLLQAHKAKNMNKIAQLFTEYKRNELVNIYSGKGTTEEKNKAYDVLFAIDASQDQEWQKIKK